jgi:GNAT superfamily N-acetyltransferase
MFTEVGFEDISDVNVASLAYFERTIPTGEFVGFIAVTADNTVVGSAGLACYAIPPKPIEPAGRFGYISSMYVLSEHRRQGLAGGLLDEIITTAHEMNLTWVTLHASEMGRPIYVRIGFSAWKEMGLHIPSAIADRTTE